MGVPTKELYDIQSPELVFCQTSLQEVLQKNPVTDKIKGIFSHKKRNASVISVGDNILADGVEA